MAPAPPAKPRCRQPRQPPRQKPLTQFQQLPEAVIRFERNALDELRREATASEEVLRKIENELDLEEARLVLDKNT